VGTAAVTCFDSYLQAAAKEYSNISEEDPLLCLVDLLEESGRSPLTCHPKKLLEVIKVSTLVSFS